MDGTSPEEMQRGVTRPTARLPRGWLAIPIVALALALLNASLTFGNVWPTPRIRWGNALSAELAIGVLLLAALHRRCAGLARGWLPIIWVVLVAGRYLDVTAPGLYGRPFNVYWDSAHLANVAGMLLQAGPPWVAALALGLAAAVAVVGIALGHFAISLLAQAMDRPRLNRALTATASAVVGLYVIQHLIGRPAGGVVFADPVVPAYVRQVRSVLAMVGPGAVAPTLAASPPALASSLGGLEGADVLLVFVEAYGAVTFETSELAAALARSRAAFDDAVRDTGRRVVSAFVESPTFGASSWLAHLTLLSGVEVRDQYAYQSLMAQRRDTLVTTFARAGYRTAALMPGMRQPWPEGAFYGFDVIYGRRHLEYAGPEFGWWSIPDQYALAKLDALEGRPPRRPAFVVFPTSTTHAPFGPVAPYQPDWSRVLGSDAYDPAEVAGILSRPREWTNLSADYAHAMSYEFLTFAGYLRERALDDVVMILVGDHQPVAAVSGAGVPWTVPVHVVTGRSSIADRLIAAGFRPGLTPSRPALCAMHELVPRLLAAFE
jgi:hypothetical protein